MHGRRDALADRLALDACARNSQPAAGDLGVLRGRRRDHPLRAGEAGGGEERPLPRDPAAGGPGMLHPQPVGPLLPRGRRPALRRGQLEDARGGCAHGATRAQAAQPVRPSGGRGDRRPRRGQLASLPCPRLHRPLRGHGGASLPAPAGRVPPDRRAGTAGRGHAAGAVPLRGRAPPVGRAPGRYPFGWVRTWAGVRWPKESEAP